MRRLFLTSRSPYARKVWLLLLERGLDVELVHVDLAARSPEFIAASPIGKVPVLVDTDGTVVVDSTVICEYVLDRYAASARPDTWEGRLALRELDELGDSLADQAIAVFFGRQEGMAGRAEKAERVSARIFEVLERRANTEGQSLVGEWGYGDCAVLSALGYWTFRLGEGWRQLYPTLAAWYDAVGAHPHVVATQPRA